MDGPSRRKLWAEIVTNHDPAAAPRYINRHTREIVSYAGRDRNRIDSAADSTDWIELPKYDPPMTLESLDRLVDRFIDANGLATDGDGEPSQES